jgi:hypothetical protein
MNKCRITDQSKSNYFFLKQPVSHLFSNRSHHTSSWMSAAPANPYTSDITAHSIHKQVVNTDTAVENVALSHVQQFFQIERSQNVNEMNDVFQWLVKVLVDFVEECTFDVVMRNWSCWVAAVRMVRSVLHQAVHDVVSFWGQSFVEN